MEILKKDIDIYYRIWDDVTEKRAVLQIFHGMVEHINRYDDFAKFLNKNGVIVVGMDARGHGKTGENSHLGYFSNSDGWNKVIEDQRDLLKLMKEKYPKSSYFLLGHSMGSFFARDYINRYPDDFDFAIIMATGNATDPNYKLARLMLKFFNPLKPAKLMNSMAFGSYNKPIENPSTEFDWLSKDDLQVKKYIDDPLCGFLVKNSFYKDFMNGMKSVEEKEKQAKFSKPVLFVAGQEDPVGGMGKYVEAADDNYEDKKLILYPNMRHEILNELDNKKVYHDILTWINEQITA